MDEPVAVGRLEMGGWRGVSGATIAVVMVVAMGGGVAMAQLPPSDARTRQRDEIRLRQEQYRRERLQLIDQRRQYQSPRGSPVLVPGPPGRAQPQMVAPTARVPAPAHLADMPTVEEVYAKVKGASPLDTLARQFGTLRQLSGIVRALSAGGDFGNSMSPEEISLSTLYIKASAEVERKGQALAMTSEGPKADTGSPATRWIRSRMEYDMEAYRDQFLELFSPRLKATYQARFGTFAQKTARWQANRAAQAAQAAEGAATAGNKTGATAGSGSTLPPPKKVATQLDPAIAEDLARAKAKKVDTTVFGLALGETLSLPTCPDNITTLQLSAPCQRMTGTSRDAFEALASALLSLVDSCETSGKADAQADVFFPSGKLPDGVSGISAGLLGDRFVDARIHSEMTEDFVDQLKAKFGEPKIRTVTFSNAYGKSQEVPEFEWHPAGLHVKFSLNQTQDSDGQIFGCLIIEPESFYKAKKLRKEKDKASRVKL